MKKKTDDLVNEIVESNNISEYIASNQEEFLDIPLPKYLKTLLWETQLKPSQVVDAAYKGDYVYQVLRGIKNPSRNVLLCIALGMKLGLDKTKELLRIAHMSQLDARDPRDSIIIFALNREMTVPDTNDLLYQHEKECL